MSSGPVRWVPAEQRNVKESRLIMENYLHRHLWFDEHIHHKDGNPYNNEVGNLEVSNISGHSKQHCQDGTYKNFISSKRNSKDRQHPTDSTLLLCNHCQKYLPLSVFSPSKNPNNHYGVQYMCRYCRNETRRRG